ncbi:MAG: amino acid permease [Desulfuromonadales bacterium]|nr:amino acid permease [Desulfuromonadales bacterium]
MSLFRFLVLTTGKNGHKLGTFLGVYTPTILTILGVIMYLRFGWVVGNLGLLKTLLVVLLANLITLVTAISLSAVATNTRVGVGGAYYIISRSLGLEIGAAIGLPLFLCQALSITLYAYGFAESLRILWPGIPVPLVAFIVILLVGVLTSRGPEFSLRAQVPVMALIALSLVALIFGVALGKGSDVAVATALEPVELAGFWMIFAIFFPAVTGIMAGLGLSGDLRDPKKSIPLGTLAAVLTGFVIYLTVPLVLYFGADAEALRSDALIWTKLAVLGPWLILPGLWGAIFSSAVGSALAGPRTLQALAIDRLAPRWLAAGKNGSGPHNALTVTIAIALAAVLLGNLNAVAIVVTMFFLTVYGTINLVAALEGLSGNPSWRPTIRLHWSLPLLGALGCFAAMMLIQPLAGVIALVVELGLWFFLARRERKADWGDVRRDIYEALIRWALIRLTRHPMTARNWRPHLLVFVGRIERRLDLVRYGSWFGQDRGVLTVCELVPGSLLDLDLDPQQRQQEMEDILRSEGLIAFAQVGVVENVENGIVALAQANGIAGIESNTVLLGWPDESQRLIVFLRNIRKFQRLHQSFILARIKCLPKGREGHRLSVHVWWGGLQQNGDLMLLLAYLLTRNPEWRGSRIRILSLASNPLAKAQTERLLRQLIPEIRIEADIDVKIKEAGVSVREAIHAESAGADVVILGLATPAAGEEERYAQRLTELADGLPTCFFVNNGSLFIGELVTAADEQPLSPLGQIEEARS